MYTCLSRLCAQDDMARAGGAHGMPQEGAPPASHLIHPGISRKSIFFRGHCWLAGVVESFGVRQLAINVMVLTAVMAVMWA